MWKVSCDVKLVRYWLTKVEGGIQSRKAFWLRHENSTTSTEVTARQVFACLKLSVGDKDAAGNRL